MRLALGKPVALIDKQANALCRRVYRTTDKVLAPLVIPKVGRLQERLSAWKWRWKEIVELVTTPLLT